MTRIHMHGHCVRRCRHACAFRIPPLRGQCGHRSRSGTHGIRPLQLAMVLMSIL